MIELITLLVCFFSVFLSFDFKLFKHYLLVFFDYSTKFMKVVFSSELLEDEKEKHAKIYTKQMFINFINILYLLLIPITLFIIVYFSFFKLNDNFDSIFFLELIFSLEFLIIGLIFIFLSIKINKTKHLKKRKIRSSKHYTPIQRNFHRLAFSSIKLQIKIAQFFSIFYKKKMNFKVNPPIFIMGLPRSGTTMVIQSLFDTGLFKAHQYIHMPFIMLPNLCKKIFSDKRSNLIKTYRAHDDGIKINLESPEAFEEIIWRSFYPEKYKSKILDEWSLPLKKLDFINFFAFNCHNLDLANKDKKRYLSKNNNNIIRLRVLRNFFPSAKFLIMFRNPFSQALSLFNQHIKFSKIHSNDEFSREYMEDIGHYDFGKNVRPFNFEINRTKKLDLKKDNPDYWLEYWIHCYSALLKRENVNLNFLSYDRLFENPSKNSKKLLEICGISHSETFCKKFERESEKKLEKVKSNYFNEVLYKDAKKVHRSLLRISKV